MIKNYQIFRDTISNAIQNSELDIGIVYFIMKDIFYQTEKLYFSQINNELLEEQKIKNTQDEDTISE